jgi:hypothetical protein
MADITITVPDDCAKALEGFNFDSARSAIPLLRIATSEEASRLRTAAELIDPDEHRQAVEMIDRSERLAELSRVHGVYAALAAELDEISSVWRY